MIDSGVHLEETNETASREFPPFFSFFKRLDNVFLVKKSIFHYLHLTRSVNMMLIDMFKPLRLGDLQDD